MRSVDSYGPPKWAGCVPQHKIHRLYELDAQGIYDEELIDEVAYAFFARCKSIILATEACRGLAICLLCQTDIRHAVRKESLIECPNCDWQLTWVPTFAASSTSNSVREARKAPFAPTW